MGRPMSLNGYAYVEGNTPNRTDPTGMASRVRSLTQGGSVIRPPAVKTSRMRNSLVCRTPAASFAQTGSVGVRMPAAPAVRVAHRSSPAASGAICCVGAPPIVFCYDCSAFPPIIPTFEPDDYEDALTEMLNVIDTVSASAFHVVINATNLQILFYNLNPFLPDLPKIPDIDTIVDWAKGELGLSSSDVNVQTLTEAQAIEALDSDDTSRNWVVRGGLSAADNLVTSYREHIAVPGLYGVSAQYNPGSTIRELACVSPFRNASITVSTSEMLSAVGAVENAIISLVASPGGGYHHTITVDGYSTLPQNIAATISSAFTPIPNPCRVS